MNFILDPSVTRGISEKQDVNDLCLSLLETTAKLSLDISKHLQGKSTELAEDIADVLILMSAGMNALDIPDWLLDRAVLKKLKLEGLDATCYHLKDSGFCYRGYLIALDGVVDSQYDT